MKKNKGYRVKKYNHDFAGWKQLEAWENGRLRANKNHTKKQLESIKGYKIIDVEIWDNGFIRFDNVEILKEYECYYLVQLPRYKTTILKKNLIDGSIKIKGGRECILY